MTGEMSAIEAMVFIIIGTLFYTFGILFLFGKCLNTIAAYLKLSEEKKKEHEKSIKIYHGVGFAILGLGFIITQLSSLFSWTIGFIVGLSIGAAIFSLIYFIIHRRSKNKHSDLKQTFNDGSTHLERPNGEAHWTNTHTHMTR